MRVYEIERALAVELRSTGFRVEWESGGAVVYCAQYQPKRLKSGALRADVEALDLCELARALLDRFQAEGPAK